MVKHLLWVLIAAGTLAACDSDDERRDPLCDRAAEVAPRVAAKFEPCFGATGDDAAVSTREACSAELGACDEADRRIVSTVLDCLEALESCTPATREAFLDAYRSCTPSPTGLSASCRALPAQ